MREKERESFLEAYNLVFDENNNVKLCGRDKCKNLIIKSLVLSGREDNYFGSVKTGIMDVKNIISLKEEMLQ